MATTPAPTVAEIWKEALRCRRNLEKKAEQAQKSVGNGNENAYFDALDEALSAFRLGSMATVFNDFAFATEKKVDKLLWQAHALINNKFRSVLSILSSKTDPKVVLHRQVEKKYGKFLRTSQSFYKGYLQRLSKRYPIPELERVASSVKTDEVPLVEIAPDRSANINAKVLVSCHGTLLHLGDLARYRGQVDRKAHSFDRPLAYYSLAHDLIPTSGYGHHQMAVVFLAEKDRDLAVVYHLYRALAVQDPHPNALQNLEVEFKKLRPSSPPRGRNASLDPQVTLATWFVKLQAIFYTGESLPQQAELEGEVTHRMQMLLVTKNSIDVLLMMTLTNITAYHIARRRAEKKWSVELSQSCQFMLSFNVRMILAVSRVIFKEVQGALKAIPGEPAPSTPETTQETGRFLAVMTTGIPILRIFMVWLCLHRADLVKYADHLPHLSDAHVSLAETISLLIEVFRNEDLGASTAGYLLAEDIETVGFEPLIDETAPFICRMLHFTLDGRQKQRLQNEATGKLSENLETLSRINDIINCGYFLATDPNYPLHITQTQKGSQVLVTLTATAGVNDTRTIGSHGGSIATFATQPVTPQKAAAHTTPVPSKATTGTPKGEVGLAKKTSVAAQEPLPILDGDEPAATDFGVDGETLDRVNEFLMPPEAGSPKSPAIDESSYGMHSATANEIFGALEPAATTPTSASKKAFPGLPWDLIYTPTPYRTSGNVGGESPIMAHPAATFGQHYASAALVPTEKALGAAGLGASTAQAQLILQNQAPIQHQPIAGIGRGEMYDRERMEEVAKAASWKVDQRQQPVLVPTPRIPASNSLQSLSSLSSHSAVGASRQQRSPSYTATPFFQSSNFSPGASGLPPVNSPWGLPPAARAPQPAENDRPTASLKWPPGSSIWGSDPTGPKNQVGSQAFYGSTKPSETSSGAYEQDPALLQAMANQTKAQTAGKL